MNLIAAVSMGRFCGLSTVEECISNIELHSMNIFKYTEIQKELKELYEHYDLYLAGDYKLDIDKIDRENDVDLQKLREEEDWDCINN